MYIMVHGLMKIFVVVEPFTPPYAGAVSAFSNVRKAAAYLDTLARNGQSAELIELEVNDKVQKSNENQ